MYHPQNYDISQRDAHVLGLLTRRHYHPRMSRAERSVLAAHLTAHPLTAGMSAPEIERLVAASHEFSFPANWTFSAQSSCSDLCYLILDGTVEMAHNHERPRFVGPGETVGLADAAHRRVHYEAAVSQTQVSGVAVESERLLAVLGGHGMSRTRDGAPEAAYVTVSSALT